MRLVLLAALAALVLPSTASAAVVPLAGRSLDVAYAQEPCGTEVTIPAGASLGGQTIDRNKTCSTPIVFRPETPANPQVIPAPVTLSSLRVNSGTGIEFRDLTVNGTFYLGCNCAASGTTGNIARGITFLRSKARTFIFRGPDNVRVTDSEIGPSSTGAMNWITAPYQSNDPSSDIVFERTRIHDILADDSEDHTDCIGVDDVDGFSFLDGRIEGCQHFAIIFGGPDLNSGRMSRNVRVERSYLECCTNGPGADGEGFYSLAWGGAGGPHLIKDNEIPGAGLGFLNGTNLVPADAVRIEGNVIAHNNVGNCSRATWAGNVFADSSQACGTAPTPTPTPTPEPTPTATPEPTPTPTPEPYAPECAPTCDELIADLRADVAAHENTIAQLAADRDDWQARALEAEDKLQRIEAILAE